MIQEKSIEPPVTRRIVAWLIDMAILVFLSIQIEEYLLVRVTELITYILVGSVVLGYFLFKDSISGKSVGKLCAGIRTVDIRTNKSISIIQSIKRNGLVVFLLTLAVVLTQIARFIVGDDIAANFGAGSIFAAFAASYAGFRSGDGRTMCDRFANTAVRRNSKNA